MRNIAYRANYRYAVDCMSKIRNVTTSAAVLGQILATLRSTKGLKQSDLAAAVGIGPSSWSRIEKGDSAISIDQLRTAAKVLGKSVGEIIDIAEAAEEKATRKGVEVSNSAVKGAAASIGAGAIAGGLGMAATGAAVGSVVPVFGTILGGLIGGALGTILIKDSK